MKSILTSLLVVLCLVGCTKQENLPGHEAAIIATNAAGEVFVQVRPEKQVSSTHHEAALWQKKGDTNNRLYLRLLPTPGIEAPPQFVRTL
jgi:uncharacterized lipoprotein NlpE involved in copper resistance